MNNLPTILVKKADGTTVRMSLDEFKNLKSKTSNHKFDDIKNKKLNIDDLQREVRHHEEEIKNKIKDGEFTETEVEDMDELSKPEALSLTEIEVLDDKEEKLASWEEEDHKSLLDESFHSEELPSRVMTLAELKQMDKPVVVKKGEHDLARSAPVKDIFKDEAKAEMKAREQKNIRTKDVKKMEKNFNPVFNRDKRENKGIQIQPRVSGQGSGVVSKPILHDVILPQRVPAPKPEVQAARVKVEKHSVGPVEEIQNFSLVDFRRLGASADASWGKLFDKMKTLEQDSYLLFMDGREAWYNSPLYKQYLEIISQALKQGKTVSQVLAEKDQSQQLKMEEFMAILKLNQSLY